MKVRSERRDRNIEIEIGRQTKNIRHSRQWENGSDKLING